MERTIPLILQWDETFDIGSDTGTPVDDRDYQVPFTFTGKIDKLTIALDPPKLTAEDLRKLREAAGSSGRRRGPGERVGFPRQSNEPEMGLGGVWAAQSRSFRTSIARLMLDTAAC